MDSVEIVIAQQRLRLEQNRLPNHAQTRVLMNLLRTLCFVLLGSASMITINLTQSLQQRPKFV